jgi:hypothetical protein
MIKHTNLIHKLIYESFSNPSIYYKKQLGSQRNTLKMYF